MNQKIERSMTADAAAAKCVTSTASFLRNTVVDDAASKSIQGESRRGILKITV